MTSFVSPKTLLCFLGLGLEEIRFRSNVFSSKCSRSEIYRKNWIYLYIVNVVLQHLQYRSIISFSIT